MYRCRARGRLKKEGTRLLVGDYVLISRLNEKEGILEKSLPRRNFLTRPLIANVDQVIIVCSPQDPALSLQLLDRLLVQAEHVGLQAILCMNKADLDKDNELAKLHSIYSLANYKIVSTSALYGIGIEELVRQLRNKVSVFAGPSGTGKSSLLNRLQPELSLQTGEVSSKLGRGKHTTRQVELFSLEGGGFVADTPGFSQLELGDIPLQSLGYLFPEFSELAPACRFRGCMHNNEPNCAVKEAVEKGVLKKERYDNYLVFLEELSDQGRR